MTTKPKPTRKKTTTFEPRHADGSMRDWYAHDFANGKFAMLQQAFGVAKRLGYRVTGGAATVRVWEHGKVVEARYYLGDSDPMSPTETGELGWVDERQKTIAVEAVPTIAFSEGMRMAAAIHAKRQIEKEAADA